MPQDILVDADLDLLIVDGDFAVGDATKQHQALLFISAQGDWRQHPAAGVNAIDFLNDDRVAEMATVIQQQFEADGMAVEKITIKDEGQTKWDASYNY